MHGAWHVCRFVTGRLPGERRDTNECNLSANAVRWDIKTRQVFSVGLPSPQPWTGSETTMNATRDEIIEQRLNSIEKSQTGFWTGFGVGLLVSVAVVLSLAGANYLGLAGGTSGVAGPPGPMGPPGPPGLPT